MICPHCGKRINAANILGAKGGAAGKGSAKRRDVDYAAMAIKSHAARARNRLTLPIQSMTMRPDPIRAP